MTKPMEKEAVPYNYLTYFEMCSAIRWAMYVIRCHKCR